MTTVGTLIRKELPRINTWAKIASTIKQIHRQKPLVTNVLEQHLSDCLQINLHCNGLAEKCNGMLWYLWSLRLNPPHTSRAVDDRVFRNDFTRVDLTEGSNDTATGEDHIPTNVS